ncbi:hypothetical protein PPL_01158 [Heterostelium album PN500]|uniref:Vacuolar protein sorting-associated protein 51 homolog n=1 Tax=Heterostelium pallidum (strain ATCC 26659 / Pp 5 / PN500) TaxID=670386 RepID=D3AY99_HETP5|nr:hypothetical protein PPL_01158 [Heterostelium album PN500]EFA85926.1 hypothetical protein PPL_01158 [Heterostelium album PN500]|eukprot:XP_020438032.1 hypothetical protein PPL_01158 [Heterostelium album PN500]
MSAANQLSDEKLIQFFYANWKLSQQDFCKSYGEDPQALARFLNRQPDQSSERVRTSLKKYWEKYQMSFTDHLDEDESGGGGSGSGSGGVDQQQQQQQYTAPSTPGGGKRSLRNLLQNYYGPGIGDGSDGNGGSGVLSNDPLDIDSPSFDLKAYFENTIKKSTLQQLVAKDNDMVSEIRTLDGDMKTLVYDNYTKFINATDIIKKMKNNVENMEEGMQLLSKNMELITTCSDKINSTLSVRREKIDQLSGLHKLLQKLQYLTALPSRLNHCVEMQAYSQAVKYYNSNNGILKQYSHIPSFQNIQTECDNIINQMKLKLHEKITNIETQQTEVAEAAEMLLELLDPIDTVRSAYLQGRKQHTFALLKHIEKKEFTDVVECIKELNKIFLSEFSYNHESYTSLFVNRFDGVHSSKKEMMVSKQHLEEFSKDLFNRYLAVAKLKLAIFKSPDEKIKGLEVLCIDVAKIQKQLADISSVDDIINSTVYDQIAYYFDNLQKTIKEHISTMNATLINKSSAILEGNSLAELSEKTAKEIVSDILQLFKNLRPFFLPTETSFLTRHFSTIFTKIQVNLQNFFLFLNIHFLDYLDIIIKTSNKEQYGSRFLLALASVCLYLESKGINQVVQSMNEFINTVKQGMHSSAAAHHDIFSINTPDLAKRLKEAAQRILTVYTKMQSKSIEKILRVGLDSTPNWLALKEPRDVRQVNDILLDELQKIGAEIGKLLPVTNQQLTTPTMSRVGGGHSRSMSGSGNSNVSVNNNNSDAMRRNQSNANLPSNSNNLFDKRFDIYAPVDFYVNSILVGIVKLSLKSYIECLRTKTFGTNGYHQIQVDLRFLKLYFTDMFGTQQSIDSLIQEADNTVADRCSSVDPIPLEDSIMKMLCENKLKSRKEEERNKSTMINMISVDN